MPITRKTSFIALRWIQVVFWTALIAILAGYALYENERNTIKEAEYVARDYFRLNFFYRAWGARMGGIYVPAEKVTPNLSAGVLAD